MQDAKAYDKMDTCHEINMIVIPTHHPPSIILRNWFHL